jgi:N-methylhydantoinase B
VDGPLSNCSNIPIEALDLEYDYFQVTEYALRERSGGAGQWRGGHGLRRRFEITADDVTFAHYSDRYELCPDGMQGGESGRCASTWIERADGTRVDIGPKAMERLSKGDVLVSETGGGAGYGLAAARASSARDRDEQTGLMAGSERFEDAAD